MPTSGSVALSATANQICLLANQILAQYGANKAQLSNFDQSLSLQMLNYLMKFSQCNGGFLWKKSVAYLFMPSNTIQFTLANATNGADCTEAYNTTFTTVQVNSGDTVINVDETVGMSVGDTFLWPSGNSTLYGHGTIVNISNTTITLSNAITDSLSVPTQIFTYTTKIDKPLRIFQAGKRSYDNSGTFFDQWIPAESYDDYEAQVSDKASSSEPVGWAYLPGTTTGNLLIRGTNGNLQRILIIVIQKQIQDLVAANGSDTLDCPNEWYRAYAWKLAADLSWALELDIQKITALEQKAEDIWQKTLANDMESAPMIIQPQRDNQ